MKQVFKYNLKERQNILELPLQSEFLSIGFQNGMLVAWFLVDTNSLMALHDYYVALTGETLNDGLIYQDSAMTDDGSYVVHLFSGLNIAA